MFKNLFKKNKSKDKKSETPKKEEVDLLMPDVPDKKPFDGDPVNINLPTPPAPPQQPVAETAPQYEVNLTNWETDDLSEEDIKAMEGELATQIAEELSQADTPEELQEKVEEIEGELAINDEDWETLYNNPQLLGYADRQEQLSVFHGTTPIEFDPHTDSVLDVGCGVGDYYAYLQELRDVAEPRYTGIDYNGNMIEMAEKKYPTAKFINKDLLNIDGNIGGEPNYDWVISMSSFNIPMQDDMTTYVKDIIEKMYSSAKKGIALNLIHSLSNDEEKDDGMIVHDPAELFSYLFARYNDVKIHTNYLDRDFYIQIFK